MNRGRFILACLMSTLCLIAPPCQAKAEQDDIKAKAKEYYVLGNQYYQQGKFKEAQDQYQKAIKLLDAQKSADETAGAAASPASTQSSAYPAPTSALQKEYSQTISSDALLDYTIRGNKFYEQGKYKEAQEEYQSAIRAIKGEKQPSPETTLPAQPYNQYGDTVASTSDAAKGGLEYQIGTEDTLNLFVWQNPDLSQDIPIRPDGNCTFPLVGELRAAGLTIPKLTKMVTEKLKEYIKNPLVSISVKTAWEGTKRPGEQKIIILGEVMQPGIHYVSGARSMLEAIGQCGGFTHDAVPSSIILIRGAPSNRPTAQRINLSKTLTKGDLSQNVRLQAEDVIFVPRKFISDLNYFMQQILGSVTTSKTLEQSGRGVGAAAAW